MYVYMLGREEASPLLGLREREREREMESEDREKTRDCNGKGLKLFGVRILRQGEGGDEEEEEEGMRKCSSTGNLATCVDPEQTPGDQGYLSDGLLQSSRKGRRNTRKKGVPWTEEEHKTFLAGLRRLGKGDWRGISRNFVKSRTPAQVASHAQKYFLRQTTPSTKKRRSSLFDVVMNDTVETSKIAPTFSIMERTIQTSVEINLLHHEKYQEEISKYMTNQPFFRRSEVLPTVSVIPTLHSCSWADLIPPQIHNDHASCATPDLLQLSFNPLRQPGPPAVPWSTETNHLELTIAPPRPLDVIKYSSAASNCMATIPVI